VLLFHRGSHTLLTSLLDGGADPEATLKMCMSVEAQPTLPLDNAALMARATGDCQMLTVVDILTAVDLDQTARGERWPLYRRLVGLLTLAGHRLRLPAADWIRRHHARIYRWAAAYWSTPRPLRHLARVVIRRSVRPNVLAAAPRLTQLPTMLRLQLLLGEL